MCILLLACSCKLFWSVSQEAPSFKNESYKLDMKEFLDKYIGHIILQGFIKAQSLCYIFYSYINKLNRVIVWLEHFFQGENSF